MNTSQMYGEMLKEVGATHIVRWVHDPHNDNFLRIDEDGTVWAIIDEMQWFHLQSLDKELTVKIGKYDNGKIILSPSMIVPMDQISNKWWE